MPDRLKIPFESTNDVSSATLTPAVSFFKENRMYQMRYTKNAVKSGAYREWITQLTDDELQAFIKKNEEKLQSGVDHRIVGPTLRIRYYWRNTMYHLELLYRQYGPDLSEEQLETWANDMHDDLLYWEGKYRAARIQWQKAENTTPDTNASSVTPYY